MADFKNNITNNINSNNIINNSSKITIENSNGNIAIGNNNNMNYNGSYEKNINDENLNMDELRKEYELFKEFDEDGGRELKLVKAMLNENRDIGSIYPYEEALGFFEGDGYRREIYYYEQHKFAKITDIDYRGIYEVYTYGEFENNADYIEYRKKLMEKLVKDKDFLIFKENEKLIDSLVENVSKLDTAKTNIRPYFKDGFDSEKEFDIEKIKKEIELKGIQKVANDLNVFALYYGVAEDRNYTVMEFKDYLNDNIVDEVKKR
ncbi:hypothetical protein [Clostridium perfringens]|uniref:hypothetical protein n=1 Tax=Clostridium perfringens TaxID=1502 RepID=UPI0024BC975D|nr:hypothetical protein [Clostridium perfringens]